MRYFKTLRVSVIAFIYIIFVILAAGCDPTNMDNAIDKTKVEPEKAAEWLQGLIGNMKPEKRIVLGYYENPWAGQDESTGSFPSLNSFYKSMSSVSPFWYRIEKDGNVEAKDSTEVYEKMRKMGLKVYPLITNKHEATDNILGNEKVRAFAIDNLVKIVKSKDYDGIDIDFELLPPSHRQNLTAFMEELYPKMKAINKTVIISVFPQVDVHESVSGAYDYKSLAKYADYVQIMTYDKHWSTSEPGAIAPIDWYEKNIKYAIENCGGPQKVLVGVGAYGYDWDSKKQGETITYTNAVVLAEKKGVEIKYDEATEAPYFKYDDHEVWFENAKSITAKLNVVAKYNPAGIAIWRIGQEQPEMWQEIDKIFPK